MPATQSGGVLTSRSKLAQIGSVWKVQGNSLEPCTFPANTYAPGPPSQGDGRGRTRRYAQRMGDDDLGELNCDRCGTIMHPVDGGYQCRGCGWALVIEWVERPTSADDLPGLYG